MIHIGKIVHGLKITFLDGITFKEWEHVYKLPNISAPRTALFDQGTGTNFLTFNDYEHMEAFINDRKSYCEIVEMVLMTLPAQPGYKYTGAYRLDALGDYVLNSSGGTSPSRGYTGDYNSIILKKINDNT